MQFKTTLTTPHLGLELKHEHRILAFGSCFSEYMMQQLRHYKFDCLSNTHGILFSPVAIFNALADVFSVKKYQISDLEQKEDGTFFNFNLHSIYNDPNPERLVETINTQIEKANFYLENGQYLFLTLGSAWIYQHRETEKYVANCHGQPNYLFEKMLIKPELLLEAFNNLLTAIHQKNKQLKIIFTLSPVRHLKDGFIENQRSKAILLYFIHELIEQLPFCYYFPAYEILMDDLRDYRFYKEDLLHPSDMALQYIWEQFETCFFSPFTQNIVKKIQALQKNLAHEPFQKNEKYALFLQKNKAIIEVLEVELPFVSFITEKKLIEERSQMLYKM